MRRRERPSLRSSWVPPGGSIAPDPVPHGRCATDRAGARRPAHRGSGLETPRAEAGHAAHPAAGPGTPLVRPAARGGLRLAHRRGERGYSSLRTGEYQISRSRKRAPIGGIAAARSEKYDKRLANREARRHVRVAVKIVDDRGIESVKVLEMRE